MPTDELLLIGRRTAHTRSVLDTYADRIARRDTVDAVSVLTYEYEPYRELRDRLAAIEADRVYAIPMFATHTYDTTDELPAALSVVAGTVHYGKPIGRHPGITEVISDRAADVTSSGADTSLVLVGLGSNSTPHDRQAIEYHARRLRERSTFGEVQTGYLMQNPAVECVRYNLSNDRAVAVPMFVGHNEVTEETIPDKLELDRGGIEYADPFGTHECITEALDAELETLRDQATQAGTTAESRISPDRRPLATDGEGVSR